MNESFRHVVCPSCGVVNRNPATRSAWKAKCETCRQPLFTGKPAAVDGKSFERHITRNDIPWSWISGRPGAGRAWPWRPPISVLPLNLSRDFVFSK